MSRCVRGLALAVLLGICLPATAVYAQDYVPGELIVKLKGRQGSAGSKGFMGKAVAQKGMTLRRSWAGLNMHKFTAQGTAGKLTDMKALARELEADPEVEYAEPNYYLRKQSVGIESQTMSLEEVQAIAQSGSFTQSGAPIDAQESWSIVSSTASPITVAIIDTGIDLTHTVFTSTGALWVNSGEVPSNGIDDDGNGYIDDINGWNFVANTNSPQDDDGHGTHVSGIVLGTTEDIRATTPEPAKVRLMALKFLDANGVGTTSDAIEAIYYAANNGAKVLNNSWGGGGYSASLLDAISYSYSHNTVFVAAAGNAANNNDASPTYPASYNVPNVVSIAASTDWDSLASFSNFGAKTVHIGSPGASILSTLPGNTWGRASGTSMATPFVSGVAALMLRESPTMNGYQIKQLIFYGADAITGMEGKVSTQGRLNVYGAVQKAQSTPVDAFMPAFTAGTESRSAASASMQPAGCGLVGQGLLHLKDRGGPGGGADPQRTLAFFGLLLALLAPVLLGVYMRRQSGRNRRQYTRYTIDSQVRVRFGDRELVGNVSSISLGGLQLNTDAWLEHGGIVNMQIQSPDGKDAIQVQGRVVWCEEQKRYGVAFQNAEDNALASIMRWTQSLLKSAN